MLLAGKKYLIFGALVYYQFLNSNSYFWLNRLLV